MKVTITLEHWKRAKEADEARGKSGRTTYCPIAQCLMEMGLPNVHVTDNYPNGYKARYGTTWGEVTGCGVEVARKFDLEVDLPPDLLPCSFELPDEGSAS